MPSPATLAVLQQFRIIYGTMRQHFRQLENQSGLPGSQLWILQEVAYSPLVGVNDLAERLGIHQSTCSQMVDKLVARGLLAKSRHPDDGRRVGLALLPAGSALLDSLPGPAEGVLPVALDALPEVVLKTLAINLSELVRHLPQGEANFAHTLLADLVQGSPQETPKS